MLISDPSWAVEQCRQSWLLSAAHCKYVRSRKDRGLAPGHGVPPSAYDLCASIPSCLCVQNADRQCSDLMQWTPLHLAAAFGKRQAAEKLLSFGRVPGLLEPKVDCSPRSLFCLSETIWRSENDELKGLVIALFNPRRTILVGLHCTWQPEEGTPMSSNIFCQRSLGDVCLFIFVTFFVGKFVFLWCKN